RSSSSGSPPRANSPSAAWPASSPCNRCAGFCEGTARTLGGEPGLAGTSVAAFSPVHLFPIPSPVCGRLSQRSERVRAVFPFSGGFPMAEPTPSPNPAPPPPKPDILVPPDPVQSPRRESLLSRRASPTDRHGRAPDGTVGGDGGNLVAAR